MFQNIALPLHPQIARQGALTKRLCGGLQNRIEQFDSATHLFKESASSFKTLADLLLYIIHRPSKVWTVVI